MCCSPSPFLSLPSLPPSRKSSCSRSTFRPIPRNRRHRLKRYLRSTHISIQINAASLSLSLFSPFAKRVSEKTTQSSPPPSLLDQSPAPERPALGPLPRCVGASHLARPRTGLLGAAPKKRGRPKHDGQGGGGEARGPLVVLLAFLARATATSRPRGAQETPRRAQGRAGAGARRGGAFLSAAC